jgi:hypothetical protein
MPRGDSGWVYEDFAGRGMIEGLVEVYRKIAYPM